MPLSPRDKLTLMLTRAGSQSALARELGVSRHRVGRWLHGKSESTLLDPFVKMGIDEAFKEYRADVRRIANKHNIPFDPEIPIYWHRKPLTKGSRAGQLGERVFAIATHTITPELRMLAMERLRQTKTYYTMQYESVINLAAYFKQADLRQGRKLRTRQQARSKASLEHKIETGGHLGTIYTRQIEIGRQSDADQIVYGEQQLREKHEPATGERGTALVSAIILQLYSKPKAPTDETRNAPRSRSHSKRDRIGKRR